MSQVHSFRGGARISVKNPALDLPTERFASEGRLTVPLYVRGEPSILSCVSPGERVLRGQIIGKSRANGCPAHSPVSGTVAAVEEIPLPFSSGLRVQAVLIDSDGKNEHSGDIQPFAKKLSQTEPAEIAEVLKEASVVNTDYGCTAVYRKILAYSGKIRRLIINCSETEPYLTNTRRLMLERPGDIIGGIKILMRAFVLTGADIILGDSDEKAINSFLKAGGSVRYFKKRFFEAAYPLSDPAILTKAMTGFEPGPGKIPEEFGCTVFGAGTCAAIYHAFAFGLPHIERRIALGGEGFISPKNLIVPVGVRCADLISYCKGCQSEDYVLTDSNPLAGRVIINTEQPVTLDTSAVLLISVNGAAKDSVHNCINCGRCTCVCPRGLMPSYIREAVNAGNVKKALKLGAAYCSGCRLCSYICPAHCDPSGAVLTAAVLSAEKEILK